MLQQPQKKPATIREVKIKTGVLKRTGQELVMYQKEEVTQRERIDKLKENGADPHDIKKQNEVLEETLVMLPDCKKRLQKAFQDLSEILKTVADADKESEEFGLAQETIQTAGTLLAL